MKGTSKLRRWLFHHRLLFLFRRFPLLLPPRLRLRRRRLLSVCLGVVWMPMQPLLVILLVMLSRRLCLQQICWMPLNWSLPFFSRSFSPTSSSCCCWCWCWWCADVPSVALLLQPPFLEPRDVLLCSGEFALHLLHDALLLLQYVR